MLAILSALLLAAAPGAAPALPPDALATGVGAPTFAPVRVALARIAAADAAELSRVLRADFEAAGVPLVVDGRVEAAGPFRSEDPPLRAAALAGADRVLGVVRRGPNQLDWHVVDAVDGSGARNGVTGRSPEQLAHRVADAVLQHLGRLAGPLFDGELAAVRRRPGVWEVVLLDLTGKNERVLFQDTRPVSSPAWIGRDALAVTVYRGPSGRPQLWRVDLATRRARPLLAIGRGTYGASFSHDGTRLACVVRNDAGGAEVWIANADGTEPRPLVAAASGTSAIASDPVFAPDGRVVFSWDRDGAPRLYAAEEGGTPRRLLRGGLAQELAPRVSRSGRLAFLGRSAGQYRVHVGGLDGSVQPLDDGSAGEASWSSDGAGLAFFRSGARGRELVVAAGGEPVAWPVVGMLESPAWAPRAASLSSRR
jgi:TolB protein